jgi:hypothetical protein
MAPSQAQQVSPQTIGSAGTSQLAGGILLESNVGELTVAALSTTAFMYTPGFLQPDKGITSSIPAINDVVLNSGAGIDLAGTSFKAGNAMIDFTVGEAVSVTHQNATTMLTQGILQPMSQQLALPVTGLTFTAKRISPALVQLNWKTISEENNAGFFIERKNTHEAQFQTVRFAPSKSAGGNSSISLDYAVTDTNSTTGKAWYRIRQEDIDGRATWSAIRLVEGNSTQSTSLKAYPVPAIGYFNVLAEGIKQDQVQVFDLSGKLLQQRSLQAGVPQRISNLAPGTYMIRLAGHKELVAKVIVQ